MRADHRTTLTTTGLIALAARGLAAGTGFELPHTRQRGLEAPLGAIRLDRSIRPAVGEHV